MAPRAVENRPKKTARGEVSASCFYFYDGLFIPLILTVLSEGFAELFTAVVQVFYPVAHRFAGTF
jgi:hypothetical protein